MHPLVSIVEDIEEVLLGTEIEICQGHLAGKPDLVSLVAVLPFGINRIFGGETKSMWGAWSPSAKLEVPQVMIVSLEKCENFVVKIFQGVGRKGINCPVDVLVFLPTALEKADAQAQVVGFAAVRNIGMEASLWSE